MQLVQKATSVGQPTRPHVSPSSLLPSALGGGCSNSAMQVRSCQNLHPRPTRLPDAGFLHRLAAPRCGRRGGGGENGIASTVSPSGPDACVICPVSEVRKARAHTHAHTHPHTHGRERCHDMWGGERAFLFSSFAGGRLLITHQGVRREGASKRSPQPIEAGGSEAKLLCRSPSRSGLNAGG